MRTSTLGSLAVATASLALAAPAMAAPPPNDAFSDAQGVVVGQSYTGSLAEATREFGEPRHAGIGAFRSVWFRYRAEHTARVTIDTGGSGFDTTLSAYTGTRLSELRLVASDDDSSPSGDLGSTIRFDARAGRTYRIALDGYDAEVGSGAYALWISDGGIAGKGVEMAVEDGQTLDGVLARGLRMRVSARRRTPMAVDLRVGPETAQRLGLRSRIIGHARGTIDYGESLPAVVALTGAARHALRDVDRVSTVLRLVLPRATVPDRAIEMRVPLARG